MVGPLRFYPLYTYGLVFHATFFGPKTDFGNFFFSNFWAKKAGFTLPTPLMVRPLKKKKLYVSSFRGLTSITKEVATQLFKDYSVKLIAQTRVSLAAFFADPLLEIKEDIILFTVGSKLVAEEIAEEQRKITAFFAQNGCYVKGIECIVNALEVSEYKVFTPKQQFDVLAKEHPMLKDFQSRFNLEIDG